MEPIIISMLPVDQWKRAIIVHFRYLRIDHPCNATAVFFLPFAMNGKQYNIEVIKNCIINALKECGDNLKSVERTVAFEHIKEGMAKVYDGNRPKMDLTIRMIPEIPVDDYNRYVVQVFYAYDYYIRLFLDYLGNESECLKDFLTTTSFPMDETESIEWGALNVESL